MRKKRGRSVQSPVAIPDYSPFQVATKDSGELQRLKAGLCAKHSLPHMNSYAFAKALIRKSESESRGSQASVLKICRGGKVSEMCRLLALLRVWSLCVAVRHSGSTCRVQYNV